MIWTQKKERNNGNETLRKFLRMPVSILDDALSEFTHTCTNTCNTHDRPACPRITFCWFRRDRSRRPSVRVLQKFHGAAGWSRSESDPDVYPHEFRKFFLTQGWDRCSMGVRKGPRRTRTCLIMQTNCSWHGGGDRRYSMGVKSRLGMLRKD